MSVSVIPISPPDRRPVSRAYLEETTARWIRLCQTREKLEWESARLELVWERLNALEKEVEAERRAILARLANGAPLEEGMAKHASQGVRGIAEQTMYSGSDQSK
jgi:hypothetical protein